jgi:hypothetical protein
MKRLIRYATSAVLVFGLSNAWAQQRDLDVTMDVVPANASANAATGEIKLPIVLPQTASDRAQEASAFGHGTANLARDKGDVTGRDFGQAVSEAAQQRNQDRSPPGKSGRP